MMNHRTVLSILLLGVMLFVAACGGQSDTAAPAQEDTAAVEDTAAEDAVAEDAGAEDAVAEDADAEDTADESASDEGNSEETATEETAAEEAADEGLRLFAVVPGESKAMYLVDEEFFSGALDKLGIAAGDYDVVGTTEQIEGELSLDLANAAIGPSEFRVNLTTLATDQNRRDNWIQENGPRFGEFPQATFTATGIENAPQDYAEGEEASFQLVGDMTIRDATRPMTFDVTATLDGDTITGTATATTLMSDFGIEPPNFANTLTVADEFQIQVDFTAREQ